VGNVPIGGRRAACAVKIKLTIPQPTRMWPATVAAKLRRFRLWVCNCHRGKCKWPNRWNRLLKAFKLIKSAGEICPLNAEYLFWVTVSALKVVEVGSWDWLAPYYVQVILVAWKRVSR